MMRLINLDEIKIEDFHHCLDCDSIIQVLKTKQIIDAEPTRYAYWNMEYEEAGAFETTRTYYFGRCSECKRIVQVDVRDGLFRKDDMEYALNLVNKKFPYCHCGCKMIEGG